MKAAACVRFVRALRVALFGQPRCRHIWQTIQTVKIYSPDYGKDDLPVHYDYHLRCTKCGDIKRRRT